VIRCSQVGRKIATLNIITLDPRTSRRQWHRCVIHVEATAEFCERHLKKGSLVFVEGALETRKWLREGGEADHRGEVHGEGKAATIGGWEDLSAQSCRRHRVDGFVRGPDDLVSAVVRVSDLVEFPP